jgi:acetyl esterase/lipase
MTLRWGKGSAAAWLALCLLVTACGGEAPLPSPSPGDTPSPIQSPTGTPARSPSPDPTPTGTPPATPSAGSPSPSPSLVPPTLVPPTLPPTPHPSPEGLLLERTVPYATDGDCGERARVCQQFVDIYAPAPGTAEDRGSWPVAVMIHGRPRYARDMAPLAEVVARAGAVVFNVDYRGVRPVGPGWPEAPEDIACAMRYARAHAADYGGDPDTLVLVGHSYGGYLGPLVALAGDEFDGDCLYSVDDFSALPTGFVGIAGNYVVEVDTVSDRRLWTRWYRGSRGQRPEAWEMGEYRTHIGNNPDLAVRIIHERGDPIIPPRQPRRFHRDLQGAGYDVELQIIDGNDHFALLDPAGNGRLVVPLILELLGIEE